MIPKFIKNIGAKVGYKGKRPMPEGIIPSVHVKKDVIVRPPFLDLPLTESKGELEALLLSNSDDLNRIVEKQYGSTTAGSTSLFKEIEDDGAIREVNTRSEYQPVPPEDYDVQDILTFAKIILLGNTKSKGGVVSTIAESLEAVISMYTFKGVSTTTVRHNIEDMAGALRRYLVIMEIFKQAEDGSEEAKQALDDVCVDISYLNLVLPLFLFEMYEVNNAVKRVKEEFKKGVQSIHFPAVSSSRSIDLRVHATEVNEFVDRWDNFMNAEPSGEKVILATLVHFQTLSKKYNVFYPPGSSLCEWI
jgi:hypothetical protein